MEHPKFIGDRSALAVMYALRARGYDLLVPFGENTRYDLVVDDGDSLAKVQCKTGRIRNGAIAFKVCSSYAHHPNPKGLFGHTATRSTSSGSIALTTAGSISSQAASYQTGSRFS